jgi:translation initiation factor 2 subunit 2
MEYEEMLERAYNELPEVLKTHARFEIPQVESIIQGKITVVQNLAEISKAVHRDADMVAKYLIKELGTAGTHDGQHLTLKGQFRSHQVQEKFEAFVGQYVLCAECERPDTKIIKEGRMHFIKCEACGSKHPLTMARATPRKTEREPSVGDEVTVEITGMGKRGDGIAKRGKYIIFVANAKVGQTTKIKITGIQGTRIFAEAVNTSK